MINTVAAEAWFWYGKSQGIVRYDTNLVRTTLLIVHLQGPVMQKFYGFFVVELLNKQRSDL